MYDDMRRIRTQVLLPFVRDVDGIVGVDCLIEYRRLLSARYPSPEQRYSTPGLASREHMINP